MNNEILMMICKNYSNIKDFFILINYFSFVSEHDANLILDECEKFEFV